MASSSLPLRRCLSVVWVFICFAKSSRNFAEWRKGGFLELDSLGATGVVFRALNYKWLEESGVCIAHLFLLYYKELLTISTIK